MPRILNLVKPVLLFNRVKRILILSCLIAVLILPYFVFADDPANPTLGALEEVGFKYGPYQKATEFTLATNIGVVIKVALSLIGVVFIILMVYGGYNWMTAAGEEEKVRKAKDTIWRAILGLTITIGSYAIWAWIYKYLLTTGS